MWFNNIFTILNSVTKALTNRSLNKFSQLANTWGRSSNLKVNGLRLAIRLVNVIFLSVASLPAHAAKPVILVYGDSLSAAYGIAQEQGWVSLLQQRLDKNKLNFTVINASISGETTSGGLSRIDGALKEHQPKIILIELGANDGLRGLPIAEMRKNLNAMIAISKKYKAKVILIGMRIPPNYGLKYTGDFKSSYELLAKQYKLAFVPFLLDGVAGSRELNQEDGIHPIAKAEPIVLNNVWRVLEVIIKLR